MDELRVLARGGVLVFDVDRAKNTGKRVYVGRTTVKSHNESDLPDGEPKHVSYPEFLERGQSQMLHMAFPKKREHSVVAASSFYKKAVMNGELWPADKKTAFLCGVAFDSTFGGEFKPIEKKGAA